MERKSKKKRILSIIILSLIAVLIAVDWAVTVIVYNDNFNQRFESYKPLMLNVDDFDGLQRTRYEFSSDKGQKLTGYLYHSGENQRGIVVMSHGFGGGGHNSYMNCANYFAEHGYYVFAYDATGNDESEGEGVGGLPQGVIDLDYAISYVEESGNFPKLPIVLFGHSWGGYNVCSVLSCHPEVKAVIACSGFNASSSLFKAEGKKQIGNVVYLILPFLNLYERMRFGGYAANTAMDGFSKSAAAVMIAHSMDDEVVPTEYGYDIYYERYKNDSRFSFIPLENKGHNCFNDETYRSAFNAAFLEWRETLAYDYNAPENKERFSAEKAAYISQNLDRKKWSDSLDDTLLKKFANFYDSHIS